MVNFEHGYIAFAGAMGFTDKNTRLTKIYSTLTFEISSENHEQVGNLLIGGIVADASSGDIRACVFDSKYIKIDESFQQIKIGGIAAIVDDYLNLYESWVYMELV